MSATPEATARHNAAIRLILPVIIDHARSESDQWVILESLCLGIGMLHGRTPRATATFIETMAERLATGERT